MKINQIDRIKDEVMKSFRGYIEEELEAMIHECQARGISPGEWVEKYAAEFHQKYWDSTQEIEELSTCRKEED